MERGTVRVKCFAQEHNTMSHWPGLKTGPLNLEMTALTMRQPHLLNETIELHVNYLPYLALVPEKPAA